MLLVMLKVVVVTCRVVSMQMRRKERSKRDATLDSNLFQPPLTHCYSSPILATPHTVHKVSHLVTAARPVSTTSIKDEVASSRSGSELEEPGRRHDAASEDRGAATHPLQET